MFVEKTLYTVEEYEKFVRLPENRERRFELIYGEIVEKMPTQKHGIIVLRIGSRILTFVEAHNLGRVGVEIRHRVPGDQHNARLPDIAYDSDTTSPIVEEGAVQKMPTLAIEVKSPDDSSRELREKAAYYLQNGSRLVWLAYPNTQTVEECTLNPDGNMHIETYKMGDTLKGGDILPGFELPVRDIFNL
jgi:Uma2 family endonuclease